MNTISLFFLGGALAVLSALLGLMAILAALMGELQPAGGFLFAALVTAFFAGMLLLGFNGASKRMRRTDMSVLMLLIWALLPGFAAIPLFVSGDFPTLVSAYFEATSGLTTTGSTTAQKVENLAGSVLLWRAVLHLFGGALTLLTAVLVLAPFDPATSPVNATTKGFEKGDLAKSIVFAARKILPIYGIFTLLTAIGLRISGVPGLDAAIYAFGAVSTGGFTASNAGLFAYDSVLIEIIICIAMLFGAAGILVPRSAMPKLFAIGHFDTRESLIMLLLIPVCGASLGAIMWMQDQYILNAIRVGMFRTISLLTTTGFDNASAATPAVPYVLALGLIGVGGAAFSTAGGVKLFRVSAMFAQAHRELKRLIHPRSVSSARAAGKQFDIQIMKSIWALFMVFLAAASLLALILGLDGHSYENAIMAAVGALSNVGPVLAMSIEGVSGPGAVYDTMTPLSLISLAAGMILGKVEFLCVLGLAGWWWHSVSV